MSDTHENPETPQRLRSRVRPGESGRTLLEHLEARFRYLDASGWTEMLEAGRLRLDDRVATGDEILRTGQWVEFERVQAEPEVETRFEILHDAEDLVVVSKPAGLPFHGDGTFVRNTLVHLLEERLGHPRLRPVQRLDRETSGLCVLARTRKLAGALQASRREGRGDDFQKTYAVLVSGRPPFPEIVCDRAIGRSPTSELSIRRTALPPDDPNAQSATTRFTTLVSAPSAALLRAELETGRTHQIRVHLEALGHPVLGDKLYGRTDADFLRFVEHVKAGGDAAFDRPDGCPRHMLHAWRIRFRHPVTEQWREFEAEFPQDFRDAATRHDLSLDDV